jgi:SAM-dependent methyltransferase
MPLTQDDIRRHYEGEWKQKSDRAADESSLGYSSPVEDAVLYPAYRRLVSDLALCADGDVLDVGSGSGRWIRFFSQHFTPNLLIGTDFAQASIDLLRKWHAADNTRFETVDITQAGLDLVDRFDLINIANVLFHIPENDRFQRAIANLARHLKPDGRIVSTEYLPRTSMRTEWMLVRSRYEMEHLLDQAGLRIVHVRAFCFFANDPMGLDGPDGGTRRHFNAVRAFQQQLMQQNKDANVRTLLTNFFAEIERACVSFADERIAQQDMPSQKLVVIARK